MFCYSFILCVFGGVLLFLKIYMELVKGKFTGKERLGGKVVVVTGANSGIGAICANDFANRGARVLMICRDLVKAEIVRQKIVQETKNKNIKIIHADFQSLASVRKCAQEIVDRESKIDILLNNAAAFMTGYYTTENNIDGLMQINYFAPFLLTHLLLDKIKMSANGRIVNVSSMAHMFGTIDFPNLTRPKRKFLLELYGDSKLALIYFSNELSRRLKGTGVTVNSLHPGIFPSGILRHSHYLFQLLWDAYFGFLRSTKDGAQTSIYCCVSSDVQNITGSYFQDCKLSNPWRKAKDESVAKRLWTLSEKIVKLSAEEKLN